MSDVSSAGAARPRGGLAIRAGVDELRIGGVDVEATRAVLAEIGAAGSSGLDAMTPDETIALLTGIQGLSAALAAVQARALVHLEGAVKEDCRRRGETPRQALKIARAETSRALKQSTSCAGQSMASSRRLVRSMPEMLTALAHGRLLPASAHGVGRTMAPATPEQRSQVDQILAAHLAYLEHCGVQELSGEAEKVLHGLDPHGAEDRHRTAKKDRNVTVRRAEHGMCTLTARLTGLDGARIRKGLSIAAEKARAQGDRRGHQQIMADLFADALIGRGEGVDPSTLEIGVVITDRSLLAPDHADAATIEGYGPVPYAHIRDEMRRAIETADEDPDLAMTLRKLYADEDDGQLVAVESRSRSFPPALARFLRLAHQTCRAPHCDANIRQNDHIVPVSDGGPTSLDNGNGLCAADNQKEAAGQRVRVLHDEDGIRRTVEWTTRYGQTARRRGINFDPLGTGARLLDRSASLSPSTGPARTGPVPTEPVGTESVRTEPVGREPVRTDPEIAGLEGSHASFHRAFARLDLPADERFENHRDTRRRRRDRHWLATRRRDHVFFPHLTLVSPVPWRGPEPGRDIPGRTSHHAADETSRESLDG